MNKSMEAQLDFPFEAVAEAFKTSVDELELALMAGLIRMSQRVDPVLVNNAPEKRVVLRLEWGDQVVEMPIVFRGQTPPVGDARSEGI